MYNFYVDATGASIDLEDKFFKRNEDDFYGNNAHDWGMTVTIKHDPVVEKTLKSYMNNDTIKFQAPQNNSRFFSSNINYPNALLSVRNLPNNQVIVGFAHC